MDVNCRISTAFYYASSCIKALFFDKKISFKCILR